MKTFYIDVYFLINFTVDALSIYFSYIFLKKHSSFRRLIAGAFIGAAGATAEVFISESKVISALFSILVLFLLCFASCGRDSIVGYLRFTAVFLVVEMLLGGAVSLLYINLEKTFETVISGVDFSPANRKFIIFSLIIMIAVALIRIVVSLLSSSASVKSVLVKAEIGGIKLNFTGLVDSGNLAVDSYSGLPVIILKSSRIPSGTLPEDRMSGELSRYLRIITVDSVGGKRVLTGYKPSVTVLEDISGKFKSKETDAVIAIDDAGGDFGGYDSLVPSSICM